ncbi:MAG: YceD family protein [Propionibacteriaceae bacterium]|nr:YceD family protein [Propionibacteriaceae bacterium]
MKKSPFTVSLTPLKRTKGAVAEFRVEETLNEALAVGLSVIPPDHVIAVGGELQSVGEGVLVTGNVHATIDAECSRCLRLTSHEFEAPIVQLFVYEDTPYDDQTEDVLVIENGSIDLDQPIRDALILDQPLSPVCSDDCRGLCLQCGIDLNAEPDHHHDDDIDSRWLSLSQWGKMS